MPTGIGWYRKRFRPPESYREKKVSMEFDGVYEKSEVWINGQYLGKRLFGYIGFVYDLTRHLIFGGDNAIAVKVDNSRWYSGSGIYRHTWLLATNKVHVAHWGTYVTMPRVSKESSVVPIETRVRNEDRNAARCRLATSVLDEDGKAIRSGEASREIAANGEYEFVEQVRAKTPNLWPAENPYLYKVRSRVWLGDRVVDEHDTPVGIREAVFDADQGFPLNGGAVGECGIARAEIKQRRNWGQGPECTLRFGSRWCC